jgi:hypothetical protein
VKFEEDFNERKKLLEEFHVVGCRLNVCCADGHLLLGLEIRQTGQAIHSIFGPSPFPGWGRFA